MPRLTLSFNNLCSSNPAKFIFSLIVIVLLNACDALVVQSDNPEQHLPQLLADKRFNDALQIINNIPKTNPQYLPLHSQKDQIQRKKNHYIKQIKSAALKHKKNNNWQQAINIYDMALNNLPHEQSLIDARAALIKERNIKVNNLRKDLLFQKAKVLIDYQPLYEKLLLLVPNDALAHKEISFYEDEKKALAKLLMSCGRHGVSIQNYVLAERCLKLSNKLNPANTKKLLLDEVTQKKNLIQKNEKISFLMTKYKKYLASNDLVNAKRSLQSIIKIDRNKAQAAKLLKALQQKINHRIDIGLKIGKQLYSQGKIKQALKIWRSLKKIAPNHNELEGLISRAKIVNRNLKALKKRS